LGNAIPYPIVVHVNGFGEALFDGAVGDSSCSGVVSSKNDGNLGMANFGEGNLMRAGFLGIMEEGSQFRFGG
jgi:hypothetical protein